MERMRVASTRCFTDEIALRTEASKARGGFLPTSQYFKANSGREKLKKAGASSDAIERRQPRIGLDANPAQITRPFNPGGFLDAK
jgi:hypothetical protein